jgi:hypothetical protein
MPGYYRNVITVEILSNESWGDEAEDLKTVDHEITDGGSIGYVTRTVTNQELTRDEAVAADIAAGGDGSFLIGTLTDIDEDEGV